MVFVVAQVVHGHEVVVVACSCFLLLRSVVMLLIPAAPDLCSALMVELTFARYAFG